MYERYHSKRNIKVRFDSSMTLGIHYSDKTAITAFNRMLKAGHCKHHSISHRQQIYQVFLNLQYPEMFTIVWFYTFISLFVFTIKDTFDILKLYHIKMRFSHWTNKAKRKKKVYSLAILFQWACLESQFKDWTNLLSKHPYSFITLLLKIALTF